MKKQKMLITLAGLVVAVATTATVAAYTLAGDGSSPPVGESAGTQEPAFRNDKLPTFDPAPNTIYDGKGTVSVTNPNVKVDDPPAGKVLPDGGRVVPIGKIDGDPPLHGDPEPAHGDPKDPGVPSGPSPSTEPIDGPKVEGDAPDIQPLQGHGVAVGKPSPEYAHVLELAKLDLAERLRLEDIDPIRLATIAKVDWGNTSLGNPKPGMMYADVIVPGFKMLLEADGTYYLYHTSHEEEVFVGARDVPVLDDESGHVVAVTPPPEEDHEDPGDQAVRVGRGTVELIDPLLATGADVNVTGEVVNQPFFSVAGTIILVNGERVQVLDYGEVDDPEAAAQISPDGSSIGTTMVSWVAPPHFFRTETAIVLYVGEDPKVIEALTSVLGPQFAGR